MQFNMSSSLKVKCRTAVVDSLLEVQPPAAARKPLLLTLLCIHRENQQQATAWQCETLDCKRKLANYRQMLLHLPSILMTRAKPCQAVICLH